MPSRNSRSRSRSPSKRHKKSHKRSRKSSDEGSPPSSNVSMKKEEGSTTTAENGNNSVYKARLPSVMLPPAFLEKLDVKEEISQSPKGDQSPGNRPRLILRIKIFNSADTTETKTQPGRARKRRFGNETDRVFLPNMPTTISTTTMTEEQQKIYLRKREFSFSLLIH